MSGFRVRLRALWRDTGGNSLVGFALLLPALLGFSFAILEFSLVAFDFHRANEATRRIARAATMLPPLVDQNTLTSATTAQCTGSSCTGLAALTAEAQQIYPNITVDNVEITYTMTTVGDLATPGGIKPLITVRLTGLTHEFLLLRAIPGVPANMTLPPFLTSMLGVWYPPV